MPKDGKWWATWEKTGLNGRSLGASRANFARIFIFPKISVRLSEWENGRPSRYNRCFGQFATHGSSPPHTDHWCDSDSHTALVHNWLLPSRLRSTKSPRKIHVLLRPVESIRQYPTSCKKLIISKLHRGKQGRKRTSIFQTVMPSALSTKPFHGLTLGKHADIRALLARSKGRWLPRISFLK